MRQPVLRPKIGILAVLAALAVAGIGAGARADDAPPAPPAPPKPPAPPVVVAADGIEQLVTGLLSSKEAERKAADARLARAEAALLRQVIERLRARLERKASQREPFGLDPGAQEEGALDPNAPALTFSLQVLEAGEAAAAKILALATEVPGGCSTFERERLAALIAELSRAGQVTQRAAPRLTTLSGQRANLSMLRQVPYVQDFEIVEGNRAQVADPVVGTVSDGVLLDIRGRVVPGQVFVEARLTLCDLQQPIAEFKTRLRADLPELTIQLPEVHVQRWERTIVATPGRPLLLAATDRPGTPAGTRLLALLEVVRE